MIQMMRPFHQTSSKEDLQVRNSRKGKKTGDESDEEDNLFDEGDDSSNVPEAEKMRILLSNFTEEQVDRYEFYKRSGFQKANIKKLISSVTDVFFIKQKTAYEILA
eukprot:TRINITY_DN7868_c0_g1_i2.p1 TRINITY_DN7868_c0_g1~~TRINITY_DN7868_c0_g1_i2.p1  ORF type:complete len:106 (-),score=18.20 TRINITY_DN7868_c0_g1_i2:30-347(-)